MIIAGIDLGTAAIKVVFVDKSNLLWTKVLPTAPGQVNAVKELLEEGLGALSLRKKDIMGVATTGYGKRLFSEREKTIDEISANAIGAHILSGGRAKTVINIGGQDVKIVRLSFDGKVIDFKMNDKCAAGTGRFFEMAERILNIPIQEFGNRGFLSQSPVCINSTCAVFAESEIVSLLSRGRSSNDIICGLHQSVARRISGLMGNSYWEEEIYLDGGPGANKGLLLAIEEELMRRIKVFPKPQFTVAFGAAVSLFREKEKAGF